MRRGEVKKDRYFLKVDDRGASLIAVVVALVFVLTMGTIITEITTTNIRMREVELSGKKNFYNAEGVMDDLKHKMAEVAADETQKAYRDMLSRYGEILSRYGTAAEEDEELQKFQEMFQNEFRQIYMDKLVAYFRDESKIDLEAETKDGEGSVVYRVGNYKENVIKLMVDDYETLDDSTISFEIAGGNPIFTADYEEGLFTLKNLKIIFSDKRGYETWISTDLVFDTPAFQFDDGTSQSFMNYALIADWEIDVYPYSKSTVNGSVYAGFGGIVSDGVTGEGAAATATAEFSGDNIVTRGDIVVKNSSTMTFGVGGDFNGTTHVWAQNLRTEGKSELNDDLTNLEMKGEINIEDDLALNGTNSKVKLSGTYNGYNFRKNYSKEAADLNPEKDSALFSSAIMINGERCSLDIKGLTHLFIAGRSFISRGSRPVIANENKDILLGESLSVRADQLAYLVSDRYLVKDDTTGEVQLDENRYAKLSEEGIEKYITGLELSGYAEGDIMVVPYKYRNNVSNAEAKPATQYYLYFKTGEIAKDFFSAYWDKNNKLVEYEKDYALAILLNDAETALTLSGELLYRNNSEEENEGFSLRDVEISQNGWGTNSIYWEWSDMLARTYKSLEDDLAGVYTKVASKDVRFGDDLNGNPDKTQNPLFENLVNTEALKGMEDYSENPDVTVKSGKETVVDTEGGWEIVLYQNDKELDDAYTISSGFTGIVIATGDVTINADVTGMVISGGTIRLNGANVKVTGDANLVKRIFNEIAGEEYGAQFAEIFRGYQPFDTAGMGSARIGDYLFYENWMKNEE